MNVQAVGMVISLLVVWSISLIYTKYNNYDIISVCNTT